MKNPDLYSSRSNIVMWTLRLVALSVRIIGLHSPPPVLFCSFIVTTLPCKDICGVKFAVFVYQNYKFGHVVFVCISLYRCGVQHVALASGADILDLLDYGVGYFIHRQPPRSRQQLCRR